MEEFGNAATKLHVTPEELRVSRSFPVLASVTKGTRIRLSEKVSLQNSKLQYEAVIL